MHDGEERYERGAVDLSRLAERRGGWLGVSKRDPAEDDPSYAGDAAAARRLDARIRERVARERAGSEAA